MKKKSFILKILFVVLSVLFFSVLSAGSQERSVIIGFHDRPGRTEKDMIKKARGRIKRSFRLIPAMAVKLPPDEIGKIRKNKRVAYVQEDIFVMAVNPAQGKEGADSWGVSRIGAFEAHGRGNKGAGVKIAIIDTGIDYTHPDLGAHYKGGHDFVNEDDDPFDDSRSSHGTLVAGVIGARGDNSGVVGVAPESHLYAIKSLDFLGFGHVSWIIAGIEWAVEHEMDIVNISIAGPHFPPLKEACDRAYDAGLLLVAAVGNSQGGKVAYPAAYESVIGVSASDRLDLRAPLAAIGQEVELTAPGIDIFSTYIGGGYGTLSGTSLAAPHVTGAAALFIASGPGDANRDGILDHRDVRHALRITATDLGEPGFDFSFGFGLVNAAAVVSPVDEQAYSASCRGCHCRVAGRHHGLSLVASPEAGHACATCHDHVYDEPDGNKPFGGIGCHACHDVPAGDGIPSSLLNNTVHGVGMNLAERHHASPVAVKCETCHVTYWDEDLQEFRAGFTQRECNGRCDGNIFPAVHGGPTERKGISGHSLLFPGSLSRDGDGSITHYLWDFGDGGSSEEMDTAHAFAASGLYTVTLSVMDDCGDISQSVIRLNVASHLPNRRATR